MYMYWDDAQSGSRDAASRATPSRRCRASSTRREAIERYAEKSGRDLSNLDFYIVLATSSWQ